MPEFWVYGERIIEFRMRIRADNAEEAEKIMKESSGKELAEGEQLNAYSVSVYDIEEIKEDHRE